jgi:rhomboid protease GluP
MDSEQPPPVSPPPDVSFAIDYQLFVGTTYNPDLKGHGVFTATGGGNAYRFSGRQRGLFAGGTIELHFGADDIRNVVVAGRRVQFSTSKGRAGSKKQPFVFFCRDAEDANAIAGLLPKHTDEDFVASADFHEKLRNLSGAQHPLASVTNLIVAVNVVVFFVMAGFLGAGWLDVTDLTPYIRYGANNGAATTDGEWWRLLTSMFMHYGIIHLLLNMWALFQVGHLVERLQGRCLYAVTYLASGIGGGFLSLAWHGDKMWSAGASGAVFGVYGALLGHMLKEKQALPRAVFQPLMKSTLTFAGYNLFYGMVHPGIDNAAHIGGVVTGTALGWLTAMPLDASVRASQVGKKLRLATAALGVIVVIGVVSAPRFDYSVREEIMWSDAVKGFVDNESALVTRQNAEATRWQVSGDNGATFARLIDDELDPFYRKFERKIDALELSPGKRTDERRKVLAKFVQLRLEGYQHLRRAVKQNNRPEFSEYVKLEAQAATVVQSLAQARDKP